MLKREVALALPYLGMQQLLLFLDLSFPLVVPSILAGKSNPCSSSIFGSLEGLDEGSIWSALSCFLKEVIEVGIIVMK